MNKKKELSKAQNTTPKTNVDTTNNTAKKNPRSKTSVVKVVVFTLLLAVLVFSLGYVKKTNSNSNVTMKTYRLNASTKDYQDSFSAQDAILIDLTFKQTKVKNYSITIVKDTATGSPFVIEIPAADEGQTRTIAIPKQLLSAGVTTLTLKETTTGKILEEKKITVTN